jgi:hypothetical protein
MATGNIRKPKGKNWGKPTAATTFAATTSTTTTDLTATYTQPTIGKAPNYNRIVATSNDGGTGTTVTSTSTTSIVLPGASMTPGKIYSLRLDNFNENGQSPVFIDMTGTIQVPAEYTLRETFNTSGTYTIPAGETKMLAVVIGGGGGGQGSQGGAGSGGGAGLVYEYAVTAGTTYTITVGAGGNAGGGTGGTSILVSPNSVDLITANGAAGATAGQASSNINSLFFTANGGVRPAGAPDPNPITFTALGIANFSSTAGGGGQGGSGGVPAGQAGQAGFSGGGAGGTGSFANSNTPGNPPNTGQAGFAGTGGGGGGSGGGGYSQPQMGWVGSGGAGGAGGSGRIIIYTRAG